MKSTSRACITVVYRKYKTKFLLEILVSYDQISASVIECQPSYGPSWSLPTLNFVPFDRVSYKLQGYVYFVWKKA